jgi:hypothetical protein
MDCVLTKLKNESELMTIDFLVSYLKKEFGDNWENVVDWGFISQYYPLTEEFIRKYSD